MNRTGENRILRGGVPFQRLTLVVLILPLLLVLGRPAHAQSVESCVPLAGRIVSVEGTVELSRSGTATFERARFGDPVCAGDRVRTGSFSRAEVALVNDSVLRLDERTVLSLRAAEPERPSLLEMVVGAVYFFSHRPRALLIDTPFVNAGAEGTEFLVRVDDTRTEIVVYDGRVVAENAAGELGLGSGDALVATAGAAPAPLTVVRPRERVAWAIYYPPVLTPIAGGEGTPLPRGLSEAVRAASRGDYPAALAALDAVPAAARDGRYLVYRGGVLLAVGRIEAADEAIQQALKLDPDDGVVLAQRAILKIARNDTEGGLEDSARAVEASPGSAAAWIARSYALQARARIEDARDALLEGAAAVPEDPLLFARLAEIELARGDLDAALEAAERAVALAPDLARTQIVLGYAELLRIDTEEALTAFDRAVELDQANPLPRLGRGLAIIRDGDLEAGRRELEIAVGLDPDDAVLRSYLGKAFFEERRDQLAADQLRIAKELDPNDPTPWFYDAIRKQLDNRPVEALQDLETAIALNDNRAVYRSSFLLDQDLATRSVSLARIYDDLGFDQLAVTEASRSLSQDPSNWSAHRFLSDAYARLPRHEIARSSELLQAQLLQPININPVQPSLAYTDLNVVAGIGPAEGAFNEFHPLFERNRAQLTATGVVGDGDGNENTLGDEIVVSALWDRLSASAGQFHFQTDGFRTNNDSEADVYDIFGQWALTPELNLQAEYVHLEGERGDLDFEFDPDLFNPDERRAADRDLGRLGLRFSPTPASEVILSGIAVDESEHLEIPGFITSDSDQDAYQVEGQYLYGSDRFDVVAGGGYYHLTADVLNVVDLGPITIVDPIGFTSKQSNGYAYLDVALPLNLTWTLGLGFTSFENGPLEVEQLLPKVGLEWAITSRVTLRAAAFEAVTRPSTIKQTIEPTEVASFNQFFDDAPGTETERYGIGIDARLLNGLWAGAEASVRKLTFPIVGGNLVTDEDRKEELYRLYLYYTPRTELAFTLGLDHERFIRDEAVPGLPGEVETTSVPLVAHYFHPDGFFGQAGVTFVHQDVERTGFPELSGSESFALVDGAVGYRLPDRAGILSLEGRNLLDESFDFQDDSFREPPSELPEYPAYIPGRVVLGRLTLAF